MNSLNFFSFRDLSSYIVPVDGSKIIRSDEDVMVMNLEERGICQGVEFTLFLL